MGDAQLHLLLIFCEIELVDHREQVAQGLARATLRCDDHTPSIHDACLDDLLLNRCDVVESVLLQAGEKFIVDLLALAVSRFKDIFE